MCASEADTDNDYRTTRIWLQQCYAGAILLSIKLKLPLAGRQNQHRSPRSKSSDRTLRLTWPIKPRTITPYTFKTTPHLENTIQTHSPQPPSPKPTANNPPSNGAPITLSITTDHMPYIQCNSGSSSTSGNENSRAHAHGLAGACHSR